VLFVNSDGLTFIGPGSEWFWTAFSGLVVAGTLIVIYRQLRLQASQNAVQFLEAFESEWASERMLRYKLEVLAALRDGASWTDLPPSWVRLAMFWEKVGALVRSGHIDRKLLWNGSGPSAIDWWATLSKQVNEGRITGGGQAALENFEWLAGVMEDMDRRAGALVLYDEAAVAARIGPAISAFESQLRIEQSLRSPVSARTTRARAKAPRTRAGKT
jgi:hypothetical protein